LFHGTHVDNWILIRSIFWNSFSCGFSFLYSVTIHLIKSRYFSR
jgi:hypothetical protein